MKFRLDNDISGDASKPQSFEDFQVLAFLLGERRVRRQGRCAGNQSTKHL